MRSDKLDKNTFERIGYMHDKAVFIAANVENHPVIANEINAGPKHCFHIIWCIPFSFADRQIPGGQWDLGLIMPVPEVPQRFLGDNLHDRHIALSHFGNKSNIPVLGNFSNSFRQA